MYGKIFASMYDGSISADWRVMVVFQQLIVLADAEGVVDMTPPALSRRTGIPLDIIEHGLAKLQEPDPYSRTPDHDGRRIALLDEHRNWGWFLVNYEKYRDQVRAEEKRAADRERIAARRKSLNSGDVAECRIVSQPVANVAHIDIDTNTDTDTDKVKTPTARSAPFDFDALKSIYPKRSGDQGWSKALRACNARIKEGEHWETILAGALRYRTYCDATGATGSEYVKQAATFCGRDKYYLEPWEPPRNKGERLVDRNISETQEWLDNGTH